MTAGRDRHRDRDDDKQNAGIHSIMMMMKFEVKLKTLKILNVENSELSELGPPLVGERKIRV